jgi:uncharacterized protein (DUF2461 family)
VRARREIDLIKSPYHAKHWTNTWYRVEIRFDPDLDEVFGVTHTKQHASIKPGSPIYERIREAVAPNTATMKDMIVARGKRAHMKRTSAAEEAADKVMPRLKPVEDVEDKASSLVASEVRRFVAERAAVVGAEGARELEDRLSRYSVLIEYESLPGAPFYRMRVVGRSIVVFLNTHHRFYERCYRRIELESPQGKTAIDLMLMALARSEALGSDEVREWYGDQRQEWSQHIKVFLDQLDEADQDELADSLGDAA